MTSKSTLPITNMRCSDYSCGLDIIADSVLDYLEGKGKAGSRVKTLR